LQSSPLLPAATAQSNHFIMRIARIVLHFEWLALLIMIAAFWAPDFRRVWTLLAMLPILAARLILYRRLWKPTPLDPIFILLILLGILNFAIAPYRQGIVHLDILSIQFTLPYNLVALGRPIFGILIATTFADRAFRQGSARELIWFSIGLGLLIGILGLTTAQYTTKSNQLEFIIHLLPQFHAFPGAEGGFNVNEIGGAMAWFAPFCAGVGIWSWRQWRAAGARSSLVLAGISSTAFIFLWSALFLGQSRLAIFGVLLVLFAIVWLMVPSGRWRKIGLGIVAFFFITELVLLSGIINPQAAELAERDEGSASSRLLMWESVLSIVIDHPLSGVGVNNFRYGPVRDDYPVTGYINGQRILPHTHNEWLQFAADLGIPGFMLYIALQIVALWMLWKVWQKGSVNEQMLALAVAAGLTAHAFFGLGDAITIWDRFAFGLWWLLGIACALFVLVQPRRSSDKIAVTVR